MTPRKIIGRLGIEPCAPNAYPSPGINAGVSRRFLMTAHWGVEDPAAFQGTEDAQRQKFHEVALMLRQRIERLLRLPLATLDRMTMHAKLQEIGQGA